MTNSELEAIASRSGHPRLRWLVSDDNPNAQSREAYRRLVERKARGADAPAYPSLAKQAASALGSAAKFVASGGATVTQEEFDRRRAICLACPTRRYVAAEDRCEACGCFLSIKPWSKAEKCPDGHW